MRPHGFGLILGITLRSRSGSATRMPPLRMRGATHCVSLKLVNQRLVDHYLDTRAAVGEYDLRDDMLTLTIGSQGGHAIRTVLCEQVLHLATEKMVELSPACWRRFGTKLFPYREYALVAVAAKRLQRPVKWVADRSEHFLGDAQGRDNLTTARLGVDDEGRFLALEVETIANMGAYLSCYAPFIPISARHASRGVRDPHLSPAHPWRLYPHDSGGCLSRRRPAGSRLRDRANSWIRPRTSLASHLTTYDAAISSRRAPCRTPQQPARSTISGSSTVI